uniref:Phosphatidylinositol transfer protein N-terminal domain-containing protein n=1 Tax=Glossina palpalis gambiensis TaxID=67801 RepID=A0A1B0C1U1_9MUSC
MVLTKEYRICMPLSCEEYQIGQLYMIARHSYEQSTNGEGVEIITNEPCEDETYGKGQYTEKRIHLSRQKNRGISIPLQKQCSFVPKLNILIRTKYEDNNGNSENSLNLTADQLKHRLVDNIDIAFDELSNGKHYKKEEDPKFFTSKKTKRGCLIEGWRDADKPIMCSYKLVDVSFEVWGLQTKVEEFIHRSIRDILLLGHRQAFAWIDDWYDMSLDDVRAYEHETHQETNKKLNINNKTVNDSCNTIAIFEHQPNVTNGIVKILD